MTGGAEAARASRRGRAADPAAHRRGLDLRPRGTDQGAADLGGGRRGADGAVRPHRPLGKRHRRRATTAAGRSAMAAIRDAALDLADSAQSMAADVLDGDAAARRRRLGATQKRAADASARRRSAPSDAPTDRRATRQRSADTLEEGARPGRRRWSTRSSRRSMRQPPTPRKSRRAPPSAWPRPARSIAGLIALARQSQDDSATDAHSAGRFARAGRRHSVCRSADPTHRSSACRLVRTAVSRSSPPASASALGAAAAGTLAQGPAVVAGVASAATTARAAPARPRCRRRQGLRPEGRDRRPGRGRDGQARAAEGRERPGQAVRRAHGRGPLQGEQRAASRSRPQGDDAADRPRRHPQEHDGEAEKLSGAEFDRAYMDEMVADHKKDVAEFSKESTSGKDSDLKGFAAQDAADARRPPSKSGRSRPQPPSRVGKVDREPG